MRFCQKSKFLKMKKLWTFSIARSEKKYSKNHHFYFYFIFISVCTQKCKKHDGRFFHPSVPSSIHGWHHTGKKTLAEINNPLPLLCTCVAVQERHARPQSLVFYHGQLYVAISWVTSSPNIKIFSSQGPDGYMRNVACREVLKMQFVVVIL